MFFIHTRKHIKFFLTPGWFISFPSSWSCLCHHLPLRPWSSCDYALHLSPCQHVKEEEEEEEDPLPQQQEQQEAAAAEEEAEALPLQHQEDEQI